MNARLLPGIVLCIALLSLCPAACSRGSSEKAATVSHPIDQLAPSNQTNPKDIPTRPIIQEPIEQTASKLPASVPASSPKKTPKYEGNIGQMAFFGIIGWAWDRNEPNIPIRVDIYDGADLVATILANQYREGLKKAHIGNGIHGFEYRFPIPVRDNREHTIRVCIVGTDQEINGSPRTLVLEPPPPAKPPAVNKEKAFQASPNKSSQKK